MGLAFRPQGASASPPPITALTLWWIGAENASGAFLEWKGLAHCRAVASGRRVHRHRDAGERCTAGGSPTKAAHAHGGLSRQGEVDDLLRQGKWLATAGPRASSAGRSTARDRWAATPSEEFVGRSASRPHRLSGPCGSLMTPRAAACVRAPPPPSTPRLAPDGSRRLRLRGTAQPVLN